MLWNPLQVRHEQAGKGRGTHHCEGLSTLQKCRKPLVDIDTGAIAVVSDGVPKGYQPLGIYTYAATEQERQHARSCHMASLA